MTLQQIKEKHGLTVQGLADLLGWHVGKTGYILRGNRIRGFTVEEIEQIRQIEPGFMTQEGENENE